MGRVNDAITSVGIGLVNACISTIQEIRAKRQLDQISLLAKPRVIVLRGGKEREIDPSEIVQEDILSVRAGDQIVVDGVLVGDGNLEMDESLLTGEPDMIRKSAGDKIMSGSFCVTGEGYYQAEKVGAESFANQLTATARQMSIVETPLQKKINLLVKLVMLFVAVFSILIFAAAMLEGLSNIRLVQIAAVLTGQVPYGLFLMIVVAYSLGAAPWVGREQATTIAVESLSNITFSAPINGDADRQSVMLNNVYPLGSETSASVKSALGDFVHSASARNKTSEAILAGGGGETRQLPMKCHLPRREWSGVAFNQPVSGLMCWCGQNVERPLPAEITTPIVLSHARFTLAEQGFALCFCYAPGTTTFTTALAN